MPLSTYVTQENVRFNGTLQNAVVLDTTNNVRTLVLTDPLDLDDQQQLTKFLDTYLAGTPGQLTAPVAGAMSLGFSGATTSSPTGLSAVAAAAAKATITFKVPVTGASASGLRAGSATLTSGYQAVDFGTAKAGSDPTNLSNGTTATAGRQDITKTGIVSGTATNYAVGSAATAGRQDITKAGITAGSGATATGLGTATAGVLNYSWTGLVAGSATGLANDATVYTASVSVDGVAKPISITGSTAQTFATLITQLNADIAPAVASIQSATNLRIVSNTTGVASTISLTDTDLFAALTGKGTPVATGGTVGPTYTMTVTVDSVAKPVSILGSAAQTFATLITEINTDLGASATAALVTGGIRITSATTGATSTVAIVDGGTGVVAGITGAIAAATAGTAVVPATTYTMTVTVDGVAKNISVLGSAATTVGALVSEINTDLAGSATATLITNAIRITSATTGATSTVAIVDTNLLAPLTGTAIAAAVPGAASGAATTYTAVVTVNGAAKNISIVGSAAQTFTALVTELNADLGSDAVAALTGGDIVITGTTLGEYSRVSITPGTLFPAVSGYTSVLPAVVGSGVALVYTSLIIVDGVVKRISVDGSKAATLVDVVTEVNTDLGGAATAAIVSNELVITSATTGLPSSVAIQDTGLFGSLANYGGTTFTRSTAPRTYTAKVIVDNVEKPVSVVGSTTQTIAGIVSAITTAVGAAGTVSFANGELKIVSATTGVNSFVTIQDNDLFRNITGYQGGVEQHRGATNLLDAFRTPLQHNSSDTLADQYRVFSVGVRPATAPVPGRENLPLTPPYIYFGGTPAEWRYLKDDSQVSG